MFHLVGPSRMIFVRHGQREDHADASWHLTATRPHDSPLTLVGKQAAFELGRYLGDRGVVPRYPSLNEIHHNEPADDFATPHKSIVNGSFAATPSPNRPPKGSKRQRDSCEDDEANKGKTAAIAGRSLMCSNIVVLCSPLVRAVQTGHHIICGIMAAARHHELQVGKVVAADSITTPQPTQTDDDPAIYVPQVEGFMDSKYPQPIFHEHIDNNKATIPLFLEPGVMECAYWMNHDLVKSKGIKLKGGLNDEIPQFGPAGSKLLTELACASDSELSGATAVSTNPIFMPPSYHKANVSDFVQPTPFPVGEGSGPAGFGFAEVEYDFVDGKVCEMDVGGTLGTPRRKGNDTQLRCYNTSSAVANCVDLHDKTVIVVGHGQTVRDAAQRVVPKVFMADRPKYTAFTDAVRNGATTVVSGSPQQDLAQIMLPVQSPGLTESLTTPPSTPTATVPGSAPSTAGLSPTCYFTLRDGSEAFGVPHLPPCLLREY